MKRFSRWFVLLVVLGAGWAMTTPNTAEAGPYVRWGRSYYRPYTAYRPYSAYRPYVPYYRPYTYSYRYSYGPYYYGPRVPYYGYGYWGY